MASSSSNNMVSIIKQGGVNNDSRAWYIGYGDNSYNNLPTPIKFKDGKLIATGDIPNGSVYYDMKTGDIYRYCKLVVDELIKSYENPDYIPIISPEDVPLWIKQGNKMDTDQPFSGDEIGKSISVVKYGGNNGENETIFTGLSIDVKPTGDEIPHGSKFIEIDGGDVYRYNAVTKSWVKSNSKKDKLAW